jgi:hypothetical protein
MAASLVLLGDTESNFNMVGEPIRADEWYGIGGGTYTVAIHYHNFQGRVWIEAALASEPAETDWFPIWLNVCQPFAEYPRDRAHPTGSPGCVGDTGTEAFVFEGNFTWLRARLDRSHILPVPATHEGVAAFGVIKKILLNR